MIFYAYIGFTLLHIFIKIIRLIVFTVSWYHWFHDLGSPCRWCAKNVKWTDNEGTGGEVSRQADALADLPLNWTHLRHFVTSTRWRKTWSSGVHWFQHQVCLVWTEVLSGSPPPSQAEDFENEGIWGRAQGADRAPKMFSMAVWQIILYTWYHGMLMTYNLASCMFIGGKVWNMNEMYYRLL